MSAINVLRAGMHTTVQDPGRRGAARYGVARAGVMDAHAARLANTLVGNRDDAALLECTIIGPRLNVEHECLFALAGHAPSAQLNGVAIRAGRAYRAAEGSTIEVIDTGRGACACIAFHGGIDVPAMLGSRSTDCTAAFGGFNGRALVDGDALTLADGAAEDLVRLEGAGAGRSIAPLYADDPVVRVLRGPDLSRCSPDVWRLLTTASFTVSADSNRMGIRLTGSPVSKEREGMMISAPVAPGTVQLPPDGDPIVLMADAQTIGGYPRIASVIAVDLPLLAQVRPGRTVRFTEVTLAEAHALLAARERDFDLLRVGLRLRS